MTRPFAPAALLFLLAAVAVPATAQKKEGGDQGKEKPVLCAVIQVDGEYQIVPKDEVGKLKDELEQAHKDAVAAHKEAAKEAKKNKQPFDTPAPKAKKLKVVKPSIEEDEAKALVEKLREKDAKKAGGKKEAKPARPAKDPRKKG